MNDAHLFDRLFDHPHGLEVWRARGGHGSFVTLDLGAVDPAGRPADDPDEEAASDPADLMGSVHIWVYLCGWVLSHRDTPALTSESPPERFPLTLWQLVGQTLTAITPDPDGLTLHFTGDLRLTVRADLDAYDPDDDLLLAFERDRPAICCSPERGVYLDDGVGEGTPLT